MGSPGYINYTQDNGMSNTDDIDFGDSGSNVDGQLVTRKVQNGGRVNFPDSYLKHIGVDDNSRVLIMADGDSLIVREAKAKSLAIGAFIQGLEEFVRQYNNDK